MSQKTTWHTLALLAATVSANSLAPGIVRAQTATEPARTQSQAHPKKVDPAINAQFQKANVNDWIKRFESNDREVFVRRHEIDRALELKPGMAVADIGAGTGVFTRLFAGEVGSGGKVYAVDVSQDFLDHIASQARRAGQTQVATIRGTQDSINLPRDSVDLVFLCDVYHHLENHDKILASIHQTLRFRGVLVLVEFDRVEGKSSQFVLKHIRADQAQFRREIEAAGFEPDPAFKGPRLKENFVARFRKVDRTREQPLPRQREQAGRASPPGS